MCKKEIGKKIQELRKSCGMTQEQLAEKLGIDAKHLSRIEQGYHVPNYSLMQKLAKALDFSLFAMNDIPIKKKTPEDKTLKKILHIYNKAESEEERLYYLEAMKQANKLFKLVKSLNEGKAQK